MSSFQGMEPTMPYELLAEIFKIYVCLPDTIPETLLQVCRWWGAVASRESTLWTRFFLSRALHRSDGDVITLTRDWASIFKRRLERAGPSNRLQVSILDLHELWLPLIDVISGGAPAYVHLSRWETLNLRTWVLIRRNDPSCWETIASLISQPMPALKRLTLQRTKVDFHAFPYAPNLEELNVIFCRSPRLGEGNSFPALKALHVAYPSKYPLNSMRLHKMTRHTIERIIIEGSVDVGTQIKGTYPSLKRLEVRECLPRGIAHMSAPHLRRLTLRNANLRCCNCHDHPSDPRAENREALELLARTFPTVEILEVHKDLLELVQGMITAFPELKEVRTD